MESIWLCLLVGLACGIFSALFGVGAGIIMVPSLVLLGGLPQKSAQGVALAIMVPMALAGAIRYKLNPEIHMDLRIILLLSAGGVVGAIAGTWIVARIPGLVLRRMFAVIMVIAAVKMFLTPERTQTSRPAPAPAVGHPESVDPAGPRPGQPPSG